MVNTPSESPDDHNVAAPDVPQESTPTVDSVNVNNDPEDTAPTDLSMIAVEPTIPQGDDEVLPTTAETGVSAPQEEDVSSDQVNQEDTAT